MINQADRCDTSARDWRAVAAAALLVATGVLLVAPWHLGDPDALSHLAIGREIAAQGKVPHSDPFTFPQPERAWSNPEWLGDLIFFGLFRLGGEGALQVFKLVAIVAGWALALLWAVRQGAHPLLAAALLLIGLLAAPDRFTVRNHIHLYWLVPTYGLILQAAGRAPQRALWLIPLGVLWANLHGSFVIGWWILVAWQLQRLLDCGRPRGTDWIPAGVLLLHPLLAAVGPHGLGAYGQLWQHLAGASVYRALIAEWQPPAAGGARVEALPLHLLGVLGLVSFLPRANRRQLYALCLLGGGLALAHGSRRFVPVFVILAAAGIAANLSRPLASCSAGVRKVIIGAAATLAIGAMLPTAWRVRTEGARRHLLKRADAPVAAARFLARVAPDGSRLFNPFNAGPWLLWLAGPRVRLYVDPRNTLGAAHLARYFHSVRAQPGAFRAEALRHQIGLAMVDLSDGGTAALSGLLDGSPRWRLVYLDGQYAVYAREGYRNQPLIERYGYRVVRAQSGFEYLLNGWRWRKESPAFSCEEEGGGDLARDRRQLAEQGPQLARALRGYCKLALDAPPPLLGQPIVRKRTEEARELLERALPRLPPSLERMIYLATAWARLGNRAACDEVLAVASGLYAASPMLAVMRIQQAIAAGRAGVARGHLAPLVARLPRESPLRELIKPAAHALRSQGQTAED